MLEQAFEVVSVSEHSREWKERFTIHHSAKVVILNYRPEHKKAIAFEVSIKAGYHPAGYGLYHQYTVITPTGNENEYLIQWQTSDSCD